MEGTKQYRFEQNPEEKLFHDAFVKEFKDPTDIARVVFGTTDGYNPKDWTTEREQTICVNLIQWLGSPVGEGFLRELGYVKNKID